MNLCYLKDDKKKNKYIDIFEKIYYFLNKYVWIQSSISLTCNINGNYIYLTYSEKEYNYY